MSEYTKKLNAAARAKASEALKRFIVIVLEKHPNAKSVHEPDGTWSIVEENARLTNGWASERGAWQAVAIGGDQ